MSADQIVAAIHALLDGTEWDSDTTSAIAAVLTANGYTIRESTVQRCPNCNGPLEHHPENGCVLAALIQVARERGDTPEAKLLELHAGCNVDALWNTLGPVVDEIEAGEFQS